MSNTESENCQGHTQLCVDIKGAIMGCQGSLVLIKSGSTDHTIELKFKVLLAPNGEHKSNTPGSRDSASHRKATQHKSQETSFPWSEKAVKVKPPFPLHWGWHGANGESYAAPRCPPPAPQ